MQCDIKIDFFIEIRDIIMLSDKIARLIPFDVLISKNDDTRTCLAKSIIGFLSLHISKDDIAHVNIVGGSERDIGIIKDLFNEIKINYKGRII